MNIATPSVGAGAGVQSPPRLGLPSLLMWLLLIAVAVMTVTPVAAALTSAFRDAAPGQLGDWTLAGLTRAFQDPTTWNALWTSYWLAATRALLGLALAVVITWILARTDCPGKRWLELGVVVAYFFPGLGKLLGWVLLSSSKTGLLNQGLRQLPFFSEMEKGPFDVYSYPGIIFVSVIGFSAFFVVFLLPAFRAMDASLEESARMSGASEKQALWLITVPLLRPAIASIGVLSLMLLLSSFEIEVFLGTSSGIFVLTNRIYKYLQEILPADYPAAFSLSLLLLVSSMLLVALYSKVVSGRQYTTVSGRSFSQRVTRLGRWRWVAFAFVATYLLFALVLPAIMLVYASFAKTAGLNMFSSAGYTLRNWESMLTLQAPRTVLVNTFVLTFTASTISAGLGTLISYVLIRTQFRGKRLLALAAWVPWGVPTIVLGLGMLWTALFTPASVLYGSVTILILAHVIRSMPLQTRLMSSTMVQIDKGLEEAARLHGASWGQTMWHVWLPLLKNGFVSGWIIAFAFSFSELALVAFLYGPKSSVLSTLFLSLWTAGELERASVVGIVTTAIVLTIVLLVRRVTNTGLANSH